MCTRVCVSGYVGMCVQVEGGVRHLCDVADLPPSVVLETSLAYFSSTHPTPPPSSVPWL